MKKLVIRPTHCKHCNKKLPKPPKHAKRIKHFCNNDCYVASLDAVDYKAIYRSPKNISDNTMRYCIGVFCRGERKFRSSSPWNRQCKRCRLATKGNLDIQEQIFTPSRSSK